jgi:hypothetical protein
MEIDLQDSNNAHDGGGPHNNQTAAEHHTPQNTIFHSNTLRNLRAFRRFPERRGGGLGV